MTRPCEGKEPTVGLALRVGGLVFLLAAAIAIAACGGDDAGDPGDEAVGEGADEPARVAYVDGACLNSWRVHARAEFEAEAEEHPLVDEAEYICAQGELDQMIAGIQRAVAQDYDALVVFSDFGDAILPAVRAAYAEGVEVVPWLVDIGGEPGEDYTAYVGDDPELLGRNAADFFIEKLDGEGNIIGIGGPEGVPLDAAIVDSAQQRLEEEAPEMRWLETAWADYDPAQSVQAATAMLGKYPQIDGVWTIDALWMPAIIQRWREDDRPLPVVYANDNQGLMNLYAELKPENPTFEYGFESARAYGSRQALQVAMQAYAGEPIDEDLLTIENGSWDCATECEQISVEDMPDSYVPTSQVSPEVLRPLLGAVED